MGFKMKGFSGFKGSPAKQKYDYTVVDTDQSKIQEKTDKDKAKENFYKRIEKLEPKSHEKFLQSINKKKDRPEPTFEGTDEFRKSEDIPVSEYEERGMKKPKKKSPAKISSSELREAVGKVSSAQHQYRQPGWAQVGSAIFGGGTDKQKTSSKKTTSKDDDDTTTEETVRPPSIDEIVSDKLFSGLGKKLGLQKWKE